MAYTFDEAGPRFHTNDREFLSASVNLKGEFNNGWTWDSYLASGYTKNELVIGGQIRSDRFDRATFSTIGPCEETGDCPVFDPFAPASQDVIDYIMATHANHTNVKQHTFAANVSGDVLTLPAGEVKFSTGIEARYESLDYQPSELWQSGFLTSQQTPIDKASRNVREVYGELLVPVIRDLPLVQSLDMEGAIRVAEYSTEGANHTSWKLGVNWAMNDSVRIRSILSGAVRAPQLGEMFLGTSVGFTDLTDPCDSSEIDGGPADGRRRINCQALGVVDGWDSNLKGARGRVISEGNIDLKEEDARTFTAGVIFTPSFVDGLRLSADYYDIDMTNMIVRFGADDTLQLCVDSESINNEFCAQVDRAANGDVNSVRDTYINADGARRRGVDLEADYNFDLESTFGLPGDLRLSLIATRQLESSYTETNLQTLEPETTESLGEFGIPKWKANLGITYNYNAFSLRWTTKFTQGGLVDLDARADRYENARVEDSIYHNLWTGYQFNDNTELYVGVNNLLDESWLNHPYTSYGSQNYSTLGRYMYAGVKFAF